jgi:hypothetical protein
MVEKSRKKRFLFLSGLIFNKLGGNHKLFPLENLPPKTKIVANQQNYPPANQHALYF